MSFVENGMSFIQKSILKDHTVAKPVVPVETPVMPEKFRPILEQVFHDPNHPSIEQITGHEHNHLWGSPEAVTFVFSALDKAHMKDTEEIVRRNHLIQKIQEKALKDPVTMATVVRTTRHIDEFIDALLSSKNDLPRNRMTCRYNTTNQAIQRLNGLSELPSFRDFLDREVQFSTHPSFEKVRSCPHPHSR